MLKMLILFILFHQESIGFVGSDQRDPEVAQLVTPVPMPTPTSEYVPWTAPSEYMEYNPKAGLTRYVVCVDVGVVYGSPRSDTFVIESLVEGDYVYPREWGRGYGEGWAMIAPAQWIFGGDICVAEKE